MHIYILLCLLAGADPAVPKLTPNETVSIELLADSKVQRPPSLLYLRDSYDAIGVACSLYLSQPGRYSVSAVSYHCDPYVVVLNSYGIAVAENDDGPVLPHARAEFSVSVNELSQDAPFRVLVISGDDVVGSVQIHVMAVSCSATSPSLLNREQTEVDLIKRRSAIDDRFLDIDVYRGRALRTLARLLYVCKNEIEAFDVLDQSLRIIRRSTGHASHDSLMTLHEQASWGIGSNRYDIAQSACESIVAVPEFVNVIGRGFAQHVFAYLAQAYLNYERNRDALDVLLCGLSQLSGQREFSNESRALYSLLIATSLDALGQSEECEGHLAEAELLLKTPDCIDSDTSVHVALAVSCLRATCLLRDHQYEAAEAILQGAVQFGTEKCGAGSLSTIRCRIRLGRLLVESGKYDEAASVITSCLEVALRVLPDSDPDRIRALCSASALLAASNRPSECREVLGAALLGLSIAESRGDSLCEIGIDISEQLVLIGEAGPAVHLLTALSSSIDRIQSECPSLYERAKMSLCRSLLDLGESKRATELARSIVGSGIGRQGRVTSNQANQMMLLAECLVLDRRFGEAMVITESVRTQIIEVSGACSLDVAASACRVASIFRELGDVEMAHKLLVWARSVCVSMRNMHARGILVEIDRELALSYLERGLLDDADRHSESAVMAAEQLFGRQSGSLVELLGLGARIKAKRGQHAEAAMHLDRAEVIAGASVVASSRKHVDVRIARVSVAVSSERYDAVGRLCVELADELLGSGCATSDRMIELSCLLSACGLGAKAWECALAAWQACFGMAVSGAVSLTERELLCVSAEMGECVWLLTSLLENGQDDRSTRLAFDASCWWKGWVRRSVSGHQFGPRGSERLKSGIVKSAVASQDLLNRAIGMLGASAGDLDQAALLAVLSRRRADERERIAIGGSPLSSLDALVGEPRSVSLPVGARFVNFVLLQEKGTVGSRGGTVMRRMGEGRESLIAWIASSGDGSPVCVDLGDPNAARVAVREYVLSFQTRECERGGGVSVSGSLNTAASRVRELLWDPIEKHLEGVTTLCISPDGFLGAFPFECIVDKDGKYLVERYSIVYGIELGDFESGGNRMSPGGDALMVWGVDRPVGENGQSSKSLLGGGNVWPPLKWAEEECSRIGKLLEANSARRTITALRGGEATEARVREALPQASIVHFATHGFFPRSEAAPWWGGALRGQPGNSLLFNGFEDLAREYPGLLSGLVLAEDRPRTPPEVGDDGLLTAEEVSWLDLSKCELVVLSACGSGLGEPRSGEGLIGLRRSFRMAGAKSVISSLWPISDRATADLMERFYRNLLSEGLGRGEALRKAQLSMIESNRAKYNGNALPTTWAAFVLDGDWK